MKYLVYHTFFNSAQVEERGVSRVFDTREEAEEFMRNNVGNWHVEPITD
jgi:hypothetical protein